jgi:hypothetical protein
MARSSHTFMGKEAVVRRLIGTAILVLSPALALLPITHGSRPASAQRPNLAAIFNGDCQQIGPTNLGLSAVLPLTDLGTESVFRLVGTIPIHRTG